MSHSERKRSRRRRPRHFVPVIAVMICLTAVSGIGTVTLARYVSGYGSSWLQIKPESFYFTSNLLEKGGGTFQLYDWDSDQDYVFFMDIKNWVDDFRVTPKDISYHVSVEGADGISSQVDGTHAADDTYLIRGGLADTQKLVITIPAGVLPSGDEIKVTVKAKPAEGIGYTKTLSGTFQLNKGEETCRAEVEAHKAYIDLLLGVNKEQELGITWPSWLTPDNTNTWLSEAGATSGRVTLEDESSCRLRFFVTGEEQTGDSFQVTEAGGAVHTIPAKK